MTHINTTQAAALSFAQRHDWGVNAYVTASGELGGLTMDWSKKDPDTGAVTFWTEQCDPIPATVAAVREFADY